MSRISILFLVFSAQFVSSFSSNCLDCLTAGKEWCEETSECVHNSSMRHCPSLIWMSFNCPRPPPNGKNAYNDTFMRTQQLVLATAVQLDNPQICFDKQLPTMKNYRAYKVKCSEKYDDVFCVGFTAYDHSQKVIALVFRGAHGDNQLTHLGEESIKYGLQRFFKGIKGKIYKSVWDYFMLLWNSGMALDLLTLKAKYPDYELWVNGHCLGGLLTWTASSYLVTEGLYKPEQMKIIVMGASRLGDYEFAEWHSKTFPYSYHIVHRKDPITRYSPYDAKEGKRMWHPRTEVWYDNNMTPGEPYIICSEADGNFCSGEITDKIHNDHLYYFNIHVADWGRDGCPNNVEDYSQPPID